MPVQFLCTHCHRRLSVGHRKAGTTVDCPKCRQPNVVPGSSLSADEKHATAGPPENSAPPQPAFRAESAAAAPDCSDPIINFVAPTDAAFDDVLQLITDRETTAAPRMAPPAQAAPPGVPAEVLRDVPVVVVAAPPPIPPVVAFDSRPAASAAGSGRGGVARRGRQDEAVLLITRKAVYAQAALTLGLVILAFLAGLLIGRSNRPVATVSSDKNKASAEPVPLDGHVLYSLSPGRSRPDSGATIIALPAGKSPAKKIAARGLKPGDGDDLSALPAADDLRSLGATVARADKSGQFELVVPRPGDYSLVIVSHHAQRPDDQTIAMADAKELGRVFASPSDLIGQHRYAVVSQRLAGAPRPFTHEFGPTDKE